MSQDWEDFLSLLSFVSDDLHRDVSQPSHPTLIDVDLPEINDRLIERARRAPDAGIKKHHKLNYFGGSSGVQLFFLGWLNSKEQVVMQISLSFIDRDGGGVTGMRFETPSCYEFSGNGLKTGEHDFYHVQFCNELRAKSNLSFDMPYGFDKSRPTIPLSIDSSCELLWSALLTVFGRSKVRQKYGSRLRDLSQPARDRIASLV